MRRLALAHAVLLVTGCQCLRPVEEQLAEGPDAGRDGGRPGRDGGRLLADAGQDGGARADAGWDGGCSRATDCPPYLRFWLCGEDSPAQPSCLDGRCVYECPHGGRRCTGGACLTCDDGTAACAASGCGARACTLHIGSTTCPGLHDTEWVVTAVADCASELRAPDGGTPLGTWQRLQSDWVLATFPSLGGTCVGQRVPGASPAVMLSCPACELSATGCE